MEKRYIVSLDQGTTSSRAVVFDRQGGIVGICSRPFGQIFPQPGWVEHDPAEILESQFGAVSDVLKAYNIQPEQIYCIGIANQRDSCPLGQGDGQTGMQRGRMAVQEDFADLSAAEGQRNGDCHTG